MHLCGGIQSTYMTNWMINVYETLTSMNHNKPRKRDYPFIEYQTYWQG